MLNPASPAQLANTPREIRRVCRLGALNSEQLPFYWVNTDEARDPCQTLRQGIQMRLEDEEGDSRILVYGHGGCGKSTELVKLTEELGAQFFVVNFSIRNEINPVAVNPEDIILVITERLLAAAQERKLEVDRSLIEPVVRYFATITHELKEEDKKELELSAEAKAGTPFFFAPLIKLMAGIKSNIKLGSSDTDTIISTLRKRPADLLAQANHVVEAIRDALPEGQRLLIMVEDLDKLGISNARQVFIDNINLLTGINANIIYTIPIFTFHSPDAGILHTRFDACFGLPMIKVMNWDGQRAEGFDIVKTVVHQRIDPSAIEEDALDLLIEKTGGVLQHVFEVLNTAASVNGVTVPLRREHVEYGLLRKRNEFWAEITLPHAPIDGLKDVSQLYDCLEKFAKNQLDGQKNLPVVDPINQVLLRSCALVEYNGERWYGVHPLVIDNLRELKRLT